VAVSPAQISRMARLPTRSSAPTRKDSFRHELWAGGLEGRNPRVCRASVLIAPTRSRSGRQALGVSVDASGETQLWIARVGVGRGRPSTDFDEGVGDFDWAPDGKALVFEKVDRGGRKGDDPCDTGTGSSATREGVLRRRRVHLWTVASSGGAPKP